MEVSVRKRLTAIALSGALILTFSGSVASLGSVPSAAVRSYRNCDQLHRRFYRYGVAKSRRAANRQQATGHYRPRVSRRVYRANNHLDADNDRTACEVSR
jgi:hypothetical protein